MASRYLIKRFVFNSRTSGPCFLVLGGVHGKGTIVTKALQEIVEQFQKGRSILRSSRLIAVPTAIVRPCDPGKRAGDNLNRSGEHHTDRKSQEEKAADELLSLIEQCDVLL